MELNPSLSRAETNLSLDRYSEARYDELIGNRTAPRTEVAQSISSEGAPETPKSPVADASQPATTPSEFEDVDEKLEERAGKLEPEVGKGATASASATGGESIFGAPVIVHGRRTVVFH